MKRNYKRVFCYICTCLLLLIGLLSGCAGRPDSQDVLRLHIIANSDSEADQRIKLAVRDALLECEKERMEEVINKAEAQAQLMQDAEQMLAVARKTLRSEGASYGARLSIGDYGFPRRNYGGEVYPAGSYRALRVVLGEGKGKNWWCVMFPPLCILETKDGNIDYENMELSSYILELLQKADGGRLWERIKGK